MTHNTVGSRRGFFAFFVFCPPGPTAVGSGGIFCVILIHFPDCSRLLFLKNISWSRPIKGLYAITVTGHCSDTAPVSIIQ